MRDKIQWQEPAIVTQKRITEIALPRLRQTVRQCSRLLPILAVSAAALWYFALWSGWVALAAVAVLSLKLYEPVFGELLDISVVCWFGVTNRLDARGVQAGQQFHFWQQVEQYAFRESGLEPEIELLSLEIRKDEIWKQLYYSPRDVSKEELCALLEQFAL